MQNLKAGHAGTASSGLNHNGGIFTPPLGLMRHLVSFEHSLQALDLERGGAGFREGFRELQAKILLSYHR